MSTRVRSHAKINLGLAIGPLRADGYHALATIYQTLAIHDFVEVTTAPLPAGSASVIAISCNDDRVPCDARNTCWKIVDLALRRLKIAATVNVHIEKRLPVQGGLGAGSANAAAALIGLEKELGIDLPAEDMLAIAAETGSDVPLFLVGGTVMGRGRGEQVSPLPDLPKVPCVVAMPDVPVSTPLAFSEWDRLAAQWPQLVDERQLTGEASSDRLELLGRTWAAALAMPRESSAMATGVFPGKDRAGNLLLELVRAGIGNDFETVVFPQYPSLRGILEKLKNGSLPESSAIYAALSGSGSTLFGLYRSEADGSFAIDRLASEEVQTYATRTVGRDEYWQDMFDL
jgi:4-diphosphocytidyl-2-C-methyl-D-erythritol kinase